MPKNIVILLDGTSNRISKKRTNVLRLYGTLEKSERQLVYYDPGVGTFGAESAFFRLWRWLVEFFGQMTGWGLDHNVKEAYRFLVENYDNGERDEPTSAGDGAPGERDRIYLFGFSRGAYSARVLAGFVHAFGLMEKRNLNLLDYVYRAYKDIDGDGQRAADEDSNRSFARIRLHERILDPDRPPIRLLGLFDTVASIVEYGYLLPRLRSHAFTKTNRSVESVRHAVAIHDWRSMYLPKLWPEGQEYWGNPFNRADARPQDAREVWFAGVHTDIGGGQPESESALAKIPLYWMIQQTRSMGLHYNTRTVNELVLGANPEKHYVAPDATAARHGCMNPLWFVIEFIPRLWSPTSNGFNLFGLTIPLFRGRAIPRLALIHRSVIERREKGPNDVPALPPDHRIED